jgi:hypothetical protein
MNLKYGDMWDVWESSDLFVITGNSYLRKDGCLVMGRGIARQAKDKFKGLNLKLGKIIEREVGHLGKYYLLVSTDWKRGRKLALAQVKTDFSYDADLGLIRGMTSRLNVLAVENKESVINMNFPGIGNGNLSVEQVMPLIETLPDNVNVWRFKP